MNSKKTSNHGKRRASGGRSGASAEKMAGDPKGSLRLFKAVEWPTVLPVKLRYSDCRAVIAAGGQATYVYRINSVFDPDQTGVGGQPGGFDQLKTLYGRYRVMALKYQISCTGMTSGGAGMLAVAPSDSVLSTTAEATSDLRYGKAAEFQFSGFKAQLSGLLHVGDLLGYSDESVLANTNLDAAVTGNPGFQQYLLVNAETTGATDTIELSVVLTYYVRMEVPIAVQDSLASNKFKHVRLAAAAAAVSSTPTPSVVVPNFPPEQAILPRNKVVPGTEDDERVPSLSTSALPLGATELVATMQRQCTVTGGYCLSCSSPVSPPAGLPPQGK